MTIGRSKRLLVGGALVLALGWPSTTGFGQTNEPSIDDPRLRARIHVLDAWIRHRVFERRQPGLSIGIIHEGELIWARGYGFADLETGVPATPGTVYRIGSLSKVFTALAILKLRDEGLLRLDDPVSAYLPWFEIRNPFPGARSITVRDLLTHTSGLPFDAPGVNWNEYTGPSRETIVARFPEVEAVFPPGEYVYYSNFGFWVAGEIVRSVSGSPVDEYVRSSLLEPLGMGATDLTPERDTAGLAVGYRVRSQSGEREAWPFTDTRFYTPAGDGASTVEDLARLVSMLLVSDEQETPPALAPSTLHEMRGEEQEGDDRRGLGLFVWKAEERLRLSHSGDGGGFVASFGLEPATELGAVVLTNSDDGEAWLYRDRALDLLGAGLREPIDVDLPGSRPGVPPGELQRYAGVYRWRDWTVEFLVIAGHLTMLDPGSDDPWGSKVRLSPEGSHTFRMLEVDDRYGERMQFDVDADGHVTAARFPSWYAIRQTPRKEAHPAVEEN